MELSSWFALKNGREEMHLSFLFIIVAISKRALTSIIVVHDYPMKISENLKQGYEKSKVFSQTASVTLNPANETLCNSGIAKV